MGMIKRIIRQTSHRLMAKLGASRGSQRLVLNEARRVAPVQLSSIHSSAGGNKSRSRKNKKLKISSKESQALLMAAKNHLPPVQFHHVHGPNAQLSRNKYVARRSQSFCQALVFSNRVILPNERVYIKVLEITKGWSGTIRFGFTSVDPATLLYQMPKHACPDMTNAGHTWARALADEVVRRNSVIHFSYNTHGYIHYGINNQDCGIFYANVNTSQHLWFVVDIYGLTSAVELIDPRVHNTSAELDFSLIDDDRISDERATMFKSNPTLNELRAGTRIKKKRARKMAARQQQAALLGYDQWPGDTLLMTSPLAFNRSQQQAMLPNLNSIILPAAQQNIYTPMPSMANRPPPPLRNPNGSHDYYQIMYNTSSHRPNEPHRATSNGRRAKMVATSQANLASSATASLTSAVLSTSASSSSSCALNSSTNMSNNHDNGNDSRGARTDELEICQQLDGLMMNDNTNQNRPNRSFKATSSSSIPANQNTPVAAVRNKLQNNSMQTDTKRTTSEAGSKDKTRVAHSSSATGGAPSSTKVRNSNTSSSAKPKARHSIRSPLKTSVRDSNNNSPPAKDCPICFERPINCVLYQCGHMCTCYECGVKQWRTQSRTCPICRTVIKDVIKTYMS